MVSTLRLYNVGLYKEFSEIDSTQLCNNTYELYCIYLVAWSHINLVYYVEWWINVARYVWMKNFKWIHCLIISTVRSFHELADNYRSTVWPHCVCTNAMRDTAYTHDVPSWIWEIARSAVVGKICYDVRSMMAYYNQSYRRVELKLAEGEFVIWMNTKFPVFWYRLWQVN